MSHVINPNGVGKQRKQLMRALAITLRELMNQSQPDQHTRDLAAFMVFTLNAIAATIDVTTLAWEKRDYWLKADKFRMKWQWAEQLSAQLRPAVLEEDWATIAGVSAQIAQKVSQIELPKRHRLGTPWQDAWQRLQDTQDH